MTFEFSSTEGEVLRVHAGKA